ncbi:MarR family winged helix-turn-helix transcriptional regulator [Pseudorhodoferax soli]|uniref:DNA-binding MarR family transcriptional regulator n=1 Tax=Pseudorhodoferax soli TaxID=545864 RepID=A0A368XC00_9BURK|nr:MarR family transcriptional regulator [Pseudorhodoferax soli]RCW65239.1 DNA-binding MarR family transcriptional regulator [Pseudorhodoferax soli]
MTKAPQPRAPARTPGAQKKPHPTVDLDHYAPAYLTWIANKLSGGASSAYLRAFEVGIETWRILVLLAIEDELTAQSISRTLGMDKASVSRVFKTMQADGLLTFGLDDKDGRLRLATITEKGRTLHNQILALARERERVFLSVLSPSEQGTLLDLLRRLHDNLPAVEKATSAFLEQHYPAAATRRPRG